MIAALEEAENQSVGAQSAAGKSSAEDTVHHHRVVGGMKAALKVSWSTRAHLTALADPVRLSAE